MISFAFDLNFGMFIPLIILLTLLLLFLRQGYKYRDTRYLFIAFICLTVGTLFAFIEPVGIFSSHATKFLQHTIGATLTGWLLAMDSYYALKLKKRLSK
ncbi:MAG: hypothetical protein GY861_27430 [bacterium]|nr:hypothetical protein [bacterium]